MILGVQWLEKLGTVVINWKSQVMQFKIGGNTVSGGSFTGKVENFPQSHVKDGS